MPKGQFHHQLTLLRRLLLLLALYSLCRVLFYCFNHELFPPLQTTEFLKILVSGLRFDISAILYINVIFIFLHILPLPWRGTSRMQLFLKFLFYAFNSVALAVEMADFAYYRYSLKRSSTHLLSLGNDIGGLMPRFLLDFWYIFLLFFVILGIVEFLYRKTSDKQESSSINYPIQLGTMIIIAGLWFLGVRGGWQLKPISPGTAAFYVEDNRLSPLVINTPFMILYSVNHRELEEKNYYSDFELPSKYNIYHQTESTIKASPVSPSLGRSAPNVVVIVLESFSSEYIGYFGAYKGFTPFLDSLISQGLIYKNAYASAKHSNEGILAITASIPALMEDPFIHSVYQNNAFRGNAALLSEMGYSTAFFHGGHNGTMGFDQYAKSAGFDEYFGMNEYPDKDDYDGTWGIFDEPFLQWTASELDKMKEPFYSLIFSLSSHHPFTIPQQYKNKLPKAELEILETVAYTDLALKKFFEKASSMSWYSNTLFVITADHSGPAGVHPEYQTELGWFRIPLLLFHPGDSSLTGSSTLVAQQTDIMPTILDYTGYEEPYTAFGNSLLDTTDKDRISFNLINGNYQLISDPFLMRFDGENPKGLYNYRNDSLLSRDISAQNPEEARQLLNKLKAVIQVHNHVMIANKLLPE